MVGQDKNLEWLISKPMWVSESVLQPDPFMGKMTKNKDGALKVKKIDRKKREDEAKMLEKILQTSEPESILSNLRWENKKAIDKAGSYDKIAKNLSMTDYLSFSAAKELGFWYLGRRMDGCLMVLIKNRKRNTHCPADEETLKRNEERGQKRAAEAARLAVPQGAANDRDKCEEKGLVDDPNFADEDGYTCSQWVGECNETTPADVLEACACSCSLSG
jgi:hypothetical protein